MKNQWMTCLLSKDSALLQLTGGDPGTYEVMFDLSAKVIRVRASGKKEEIFPIPGKNELLNLLNKTFIYKTSPPPEPPSNWYPGANTWENKGSYQVKYNFNEQGKCIEIMIAKPGLSKRLADKEHFHIFLTGPDQGINFKDAQGRLKNLSDHDIKMILSGGARPLF